MNVMEEDDMDEDEAIEAATERGKETYNNDGEAGIFICCELCSKYKDPDQNLDCRYNAWELILEPGREWSSHHSRMSKSNGGG